MVKVVCWPVIDKKSVDAWNNSFLNLENIDVVAYIDETEDLDNKRVPIDKINQIRWDYLLVYENGCRDLVEDILDMCKIEKTRVLYPMDRQHMLDKIEHISRICNDKYCMYLRLLQNQMIGKYFSCSVKNGEISYVGSSKDTQIMGHMYFAKSNWAEEEMIQFYELSKKYYDIENKKGYFCDIGANIGTTSIYFKKEIDENVQIIAFEPVKDTYKLLKINMILNDIEDSIIVNKGVSDKKTEKVFEYNVNNPGASSFRKDNNVDSNDGEIASLISFDEFIEDNNINPEDIKYIWVDVEGFEGHFFAGAKNTLKKISVPTVMEFTPRFLNELNTFDSFIDDLNSMYKGYIKLQDSKMEVHDILDLKEYRDVEMEDDMNYEQFDIFLLK